jgi:hypothetical protein|tara:strand:- start:2264 stop:2641 length:378 start_codon:yes stop_codon:yes gene_type:complete
MMGDFDKLIRDRSEYKQTREEKYKYDSKDRLSKILKKKVQTTMIGAISSIEDHFSFLWNAEDSEMTEEKKFMYEAFQKVRSEILDKGNTQARNVDAELNQYEIRWMKYSMDIPVKKPIGGTQEDE